MPSSIRKSAAALAALGALALAYPDRLAGYLT